jgi:hypothetical protein
MSVVFSEKKAQIMERGQKSTAKPPLPQLGSGGSSVDRGSWWARTNLNPASTSWVTAIRRLVA